MPAFVSKNSNDILRRALDKLQNKTPITAIAPGSVARAITEVMTKELGDLYSIVDFNTSMAFLSTASGRALDLIGSLYNVQRKQLSEIAAIDQSLGAFYFYLDSPYGSLIEIPAGTQVTSSTTNFIGDQIVYATTENVRIAPGRTRVYASIRPLFADSIFTVGANTLISHSFPSPSGTTVRCINPKPIQAQVGYENDDSYRTRIIKGIRTSAGGTEEALRFTSLAVPGVRDVRIRVAPYGLGSFEVIVVAESNAISQGVLLQTATALQAVRPVGTRMFVTLPDILPVEISATIVLRDVSGLDRPAIARRVEVGALRYVNTLLAGSPLIYNQLIQSMLNSSDVVSDVVINSFKLNAREVLRRNINVEEDQQIIPGAIKISYT